MRPVLCFGEALIDFLHQDVIQQDQLTLPAFRQYPGGAPANAAVAVSKLGGNAKFAGQVGQDSFGDFLQNALTRYGVNTELLARHPSAKTALAFVMLDDTGDRSFSFYRDNSADVLFTSQQVDARWFVDSPVFHFCSNTLTTVDIASCTREIVTQARAQQCLVSFDVNLRHNLWEGGQANRALVNELVFQSHLVKLSKDEFDYLSDGQADSYIAQCLAQHCELLVVTDGEGQIDYYYEGHHGQVIPPKIKAVDTTAGGDGFIGGMLFLLSHLTDPFKALSNRQTVSEVIAFASCCGAIAVSQPGAFPALPSFQAATDLHSQTGFNSDAIRQLLQGKLL
jgi:fructokinase